MTIDFFEGAAGTGKTHSLVERAAELVGSGTLGEGQKILALTFMNGARRRLSSRLGEIRSIRRRFDCLTFDAFARTLVARRRSLVSPAMQEQVAALGEFDGPCALAAGLLGHESVRQWLARTYPLVLVDEAQDLDEHRCRVLQELSRSSRIVAAADAFQCLHEGRDIGPLMGWLENAGETHHLTQQHRTQQQGLLSAAREVREGRDMRAVLAENRYKNRTKWDGPGIRLFEVPIKHNNSGLLAWAIADDLSQRRGRFAILTPHAGNAVIRRALETVRNTRYTRKNGVATLGPYPHAWDRSDMDEADSLLGGIALPETASYAGMRELLMPLAEQAVIKESIKRMDRLRRVGGQAEFTKGEAVELVREATRDRSRLGFQQRRGNLAMTIHRAKNREFPNVVVLWPHTVIGSAEHLRRLLYNGMTRAQGHCTVVVLGQGRLNAPPFAPQA